MPDITQEEIFKRYEELPEDLKTAMYSASTAEIIYQIGKKHGLNIEETGDLTTEVAKILLGLNHPKNFISTLADVFDLSKEKATEIAQDVNHEIFFPIREELKKLHGIGASSELTPPTATNLPQQKLVSPEPQETITPKPVFTKPEDQPMTQTAESVKKEPSEPQESKKPETPSLINPALDRKALNSEARTDADTTETKLQNGATLKGGVKPQIENRLESSPQKQVNEDKYREPID